MRTRDEEIKNKGGTICTPLEMIAKNGKKREILSSNTEGNYLEEIKEKKKLKGED